MISPDDFLRELRQLYGKETEHSNPSQEYLRIHQAQQAVMGIAGLDPQSWLDSFLAETVREVGNLLIQPPRGEIATRIAVGTLDHIAVNAIICRHREYPVYAILVHRGFVSMVNHYAKLITAANFPTEVVYYQGINLSGLGRSTYSQAVQRMLREYREKGVVNGPELKLKTGGEALLRIEFLLRQLYGFVLAHELGHYVNGDLAENKSLISLGGVTCALVAAPDRSHEKEYRADEFAFEALLHLVARIEPNFPARRLLELSAVVLFNLLREGSDIGTASHPPSSQRLLRLVVTFFGKTPRDLMEASFSDLTKIAQFNEAVGIIPVADILAKRTRRWFAAKSPIDDSR